MSRTNVSAAVRCLCAWLGGTGAVAIDGLMEDAATAETSRAQVWQWVRWGVQTDDGEVVTRERVEEVIVDVVRGLKQPDSPGNPVDAAADLFRAVALNVDEFSPFLMEIAHARHLVATWRADGRQPRRG